MHELPTEFSIRQWIYTQVSRDGEVAIYRQWRTDAAVERFEVIRVHHKPVQVFPNGTVQDAGEYYPGSAQWGAAGWTFFTLAAAQAHAAQLAQRSIRHAVD